MAKINWQIVGWNIAEAREQLERIEKSIRDGDPPDEGALKVQMEHALHHLAFAWNIRRVSTKRYSNLTDKEFNEWSKFPPELEPFRIES